MVASRRTFEFSLFYFSAVSSPVDVINRVRNLTDDSLVRNRDSRSQLPRKPSSLCL